MKSTSIDAFGASYKGPGRQKNDDRFLLRSLEHDRYLLAVSDGMGGHPGGDQAAEQVVVCVNDVSSSKSITASSLASALIRADSLISEKVNRLPEMRGMGATATAVFLGEGRISWAHIGDSRLYLVRNGIMTQITRDHSYVQTLIDAGDISPEEAATHPLSHVLDQCIGCMDAGVDTGEFEMIPGDLLLLCTDGIYRKGKDARIQRYLTGARNATECVETLLKASEECGNTDDATLIAAFIE